MPFLLLVGLSLLPSAQAAGGPPGWRTSTATIPLVKGTGSWQLGQAPSPSLTGTLAVSDPNTHEVYTWTGEELTLSGRRARGGAALRFAASPAGSVRTWAVWFVGYDGELLGDPEVLDVVFDEHGNGDIVARAAAGAVTRLRVAAGRDPGSANTEVTVVDGGADAAWVGIAELETDDAESALLCDADLRELDATGYAAFLEHGFDALVPVEEAEIVLSGDFSVAGLDIAGGVVHAGAELRWDISLVDGTSLVCTRGADCTEEPLVVDVVSFLAPVASIRGRRTEPPPLKLRPADQTWDAWDADVEVGFEGVALGSELELSGVLVATDGDRRLDAVALSLDPRSFAVQSTGTGALGALGADDALSWSSLAARGFEVSAFDPTGRLVAEHRCTMAPTPATLAGTARLATLVGECTDATDTHVRRLRARLDGDQAELTVDLAGPAFTWEWEEPCLERGCTPATTRVIDGVVQVSVDGTPIYRGPMASTEVVFGLPFSFASDVAGADAEVEIEVSAAAGLTVRGDGADTFEVYRGEELVEGFTCDQVSVEATGRYDWGGGAGLTCTGPRIRRAWTR